MKMKRTLSYLVASIMILSMLPAMPLTSSAGEVPGDWDTFRAVTDYDYPEKAETYTPAPGYEYTSEGFQTVQADYTNSHIFFTVGSKEPHPCKDGAYMQVRIDDFPYDGGTNADEWISFHIWTAQNMSPGDITHGSGWQCLLRGAGGGSTKIFENHVTIETVGDTPGSFRPYGAASVTPELDDEGREIYNFAVDYTDDFYTVSLNGAAVTGADADAINDKLHEIKENGEYYLGVTLFSTVQDEKGGLTILKFGTNPDTATVPVGSDSKDPEENVNKPPADLMDASTIPANQPALLWDANRTSFMGDPGAQNMTLTAQGDGSFHCVAGDTLPFVSWGIKRDLSYRAEDFPVFTALLHRYLGHTGTLYFCAGDIVAAQSDAMLNWDSYEENNRFYGEDDEYFLLVVDLSDELFEGRINAMRPAFLVDDPTDAEQAEFDIMWMGMFRNTDEARAYSDAFVQKLGVSIETEAPTEAPTSAPTATPTAASPEAPTEAPTGESAASETEAPAEKTDDGKGCKSLMGTGAAALLVAASAAFVLRRRRR